MLDGVIHESFGFVAISSLSNEKNSGVDVFRSTGRRHSRARSILVDRSHESALAVEKTLRGIGVGKSLLAVVVVANFYAPRASCWTHAGHSGY